MFFANINFYVLPFSSNLESDIYNGTNNGSRKISSSEFVRVNPGSTLSSEVVMYNFSRAMLVTNAEGSLEVLNSSE